MEPPATTTPEPTRPERLLVLALTPVAATLAAAARLGKQYPRATITVGVAEVDRWKLAAVDLPALVLGEHRLDLRAPATQALLEQHGFDQVFVPVGLPRQPPRDATRLLGRGRAQRCRLLGLGLHRCRSRLLVRLLLLLYHLLCWLPLSLGLGLARQVDALALLTLAVAARLVRRTAPVPDPGRPVCHVINTLGTGGAQRQLLEYLRCRRVTGPPIQLLVFSEYNRFYQDELAHLGVNHEVLATTCQAHLLGRLFYRLVPQTTTLVLLRRRLRALGAQTVYSWLFATNIVAVPAARLARVPRICSSVRNLSAWKTWPGYRRWWYRLADRLTAPCCDLIVANARAVADDFAAWAGITRERITVISNGIDPARLQAAATHDIRSNLGIPDQVPLVLSIGRLAAEKNQAMLLRCCARLLAQGLELCLVIVGHGADEAALRQLTAELAITDRVFFTGKTAAPQSFYRAADLFALSSRIEGMPNVVMEAQALGLPVVTTASGGAAEVVEHGVTGLVVEVDDEAGFEAALAQLLQDPQLRHEMGRRAQERIATVFSVAAMAAAIDAVSGWDEVSGCGEASGCALAPSETTQHGARVTPDQQLKG